MTDIDTVQYRKSQLFAPLMKSYDDSLFAIQVTTASGSTKHMNINREELLEIVGVLTKEVE